jgi:hypothetical protein
MWIHDLRGRPARALAWGPYYEAQAVEGVGCAPPSARSLRGAFQPMRHFPVGSVVCLLGAAGPILFNRRPRRPAAALSFGGRGWFGLGFMTRPPSGAEMTGLRIVVSLLALMTVSPAIAQFIGPPTFNFPQPPMVVVPPTSPKMCCREECSPDTSCRRGSSCPSICVQKCTPCS